MRKPTGWMSNSECILRALSKRCTQTDGSCSRPKGGQHVQCSSAIARRAAVYPFAICKGILQGILDQLQQDRRLISGIHAILPEPSAGFEEEYSEEYLFGREDESAEEFGVDSRQNRTAREDRAHTGVGCSVTLGSDPGVAVQPTNQSSRQSTHHPAFPNACGSPGGGRRGRQTKGRREP